MMESRSRLVDRLDEKLGIGTKRTLLISQLGLLRLRPEIAILQGLFFSSRLCFLIRFSGIRSDT